MILQKIDCSINVSNMKNCMTFSIFPVMDFSMSDSIQLEASWKAHLRPEFGKPYMHNLKRFLESEMNRKKQIFPKGREYFNAFEYTPFDLVKVVILGQDPYHGAGQAHGLCFSVPRGIPVPPSLENIYKELYSDLDIPVVSHGCLENWAKEGVLLLNTTLTVEKGKPGSHRGRGWEEFTHKSCLLLSEKRENLVFLLWGRSARSKSGIIDKSRHLVLEAPHPSPLSAHQGFFGCKHFSKANAYLESKGETPIDWSAHLKS